MTTSRATLFSRATPLTGAACFVGLWAAGAVAGSAAVPVDGVPRAAEAPGAGPPTEGPVAEVTRLAAAAVVAVEAERAGTPAGPSPEPVPAASDGGARRWAAARQAYDGPVLDAAWFAERRVVVFLVPPGGLPAVRGPAAAVIREHWTAGDWSLKYVFVSSVPSKPIFLAGRRIGLYDLASAVTKEAGQGDEFVAANEDYVRQNVFFVHDPEAAAWAELLGADREDGRSTTVVLLEGGRAVKAVDVERFDYDSAEGAAAREAFGERLAGEVRELLPSR